MKTISTTHLIKVCLSFILLFSIGMTPSCLNAHASEKQITKNYNIPDFHSIKAQQGIKVIYTQGKATGNAQARVAERIEKYLRVKVENGCLNLYFENKNNGNLNIDSETVVTVQSPNLKSVKLSSAANFVAKNNISLKSDISFSISSAGEADLMDLACSSLDLDLSSAAEFSAKSVTGKTTIDLSSAADAEIDVLNSPVADFTTSSAAELEVKKYTGKSLKVSASSGSSVEVSNINSAEVSATASSGASISVNGKCTNLSTSESSGGSVDNNGMKCDNLTVMGKPSKAQKAAFEAQQRAFEAQQKAFEVQKRVFEEQKQAAKTAKDSAKMAAKSSSQKDKKDKNKKSTGKSESENGLRIP